MVVAIQPVLRTATALTQRSELLRGGVGPASGGNAAQPRLQKVLNRISETTPAGQVEIGSKSAIFGFFLSSIFLDFSWEMALQVLSSRTGFAARLFHPRLSTRPGLTAT